jgi:hypothetical protein
MARHREIKRKVTQMKKRKSMIYYYPNFLLLRIIVIFIISNCHEVFMKREKNTTLI